MALAGDSSPDSVPSPPSEVSAPPELPTTTVVEPLSMIDSVVVDPTDVVVDVVDGSAGVESPDRSDGADEAAAPDAAAGELESAESVVDAAPESVGSAQATKGVVATAAPTPRATASAPTRPMYLA